MECGNQNKKLFQYMLVENFFTEQELSSIWLEIDSFHDQQLFKDDQTGAAPASIPGVSNASRTGFFLEDKGINSQETNIYKSCSKIFQSDTTKFAQLDFANYPTLDTDTSSTLLSLYVNKDYYRTHHDLATTSVLFWLCRQPKKFKGGDLFFPQLKETVEFKHNSMIMFPSQAEHGVTEVVMDPTISKKYGRYCITMFLKISNM